MPNDPTFDQPGWQPQNVYNVAGYLNQGATAPAESVPPLIALPYPPNRIYLGRDDELARLADWLTRPHAVVAITGLVGVGRRRNPASIAQ